MPESAAQHRHGLHDPETIRPQSSRWIRVQRKTEAEEARKTAKKAKDKAKAEARAKKKGKRKQPKK